MINKSMNNKELENKDKIQPEKLEKKPNETGGINFSSHVKIFDPNTKEVLAQLRAD